MKRIIYFSFVIVILLSLFSGCSYSSFTDFDFGVSTGKSTQTGESSLDASGIDEMEVDLGVGMITISKSSGSEVEIKYKKEVKGNSEFVKEVADNILINIEKSGNKLIVEAKTNDEDNDDFWQWLSNKYKNINVSIDFDIKVPENIEIFKVSDGVGDIVIKDLEGQFEVEGGVGSLRMKNVSMVDKCVISRGTGDINLDCNIDNADCLSVQSGVGSINISLPKDSRFSLDAAAGVGDIKGNLIVPNKESFVGDNLKQDVNGGGTKLELTAGTGSITINKK